MNDTTRRAITLAGRGINKKRKDYYETGGARPGERISERLTKS
jgi:hypothetical protein